MYICKEINYNGLDFLTERSMLGNSAAIIDLTVKLPFESCHEKTCLGVCDQG